MNSEIVKRLNDTLEKFGISKAKASRDMGYSSAILSAYTTGNYSGDLTKLEDNIVRWIARQEQAHSRKRAFSLIAGTMGDSSSFSSRMLVLAAELASMFVRLAHSQPSM